MIRLCLLLLVSVVLQWLSEAPAQAQQYEPARTPGAIDLSGWDGTGTVALNGKWELYWHQLLTPAELGANRDQSAGPPEPLAIQVPLQWGEYRTADGKPLPSQGYATYRLVLHISEEAGRRPLALYVRGIATAYRMWFNGDEVAGNGVVGTSRETMVPVNVPKVIAVQPHAGSNELVVQVSNYVQRKGGIWESIRIGGGEAILRERFVHLSSEMFVVGCLCVMGLYHFGLFAFRRKDKSPLYFGGLCLAIAARTLVLGEAAALYMFPGIPWEAAVKVEYISVYAALLMLVLFVHNEYGASGRSPAKTLSYAAQGAFTLFVLATPAIVYTKILLTYQLLVAVPVLIYTLIMYVRALLRRRQGSAVNMAGFVAFGASAGVDILFYNQVVAYGTFIPYGILVFLFTQSINLSSRFSRTSRVAEQLSQQLAAVNESLERTVAERTVDLQQTNRSLEQANAELSRMSEFRQRLLSDISHELGTPITSIKGFARAILDGMIKDDPLKYVSRIYDRTRLMERLIEDLTELAKLEMRQIRFDFKEVEVVPFFLQLCEIYAAEVPDHDIVYGEAEPVGAAERAGVLIASVDPIRIEQVVANLLSNARKYTPNGGRISIELGVPEDGGDAGAAKTITVSVTDTGAGIPAEEAAHVFSRFYRGRGGAAQRADGSGLGLAICKEIVHYHGGTIGLESKPGTGSRFYFTLPVRHRLGPAGGN